MRADTSPTGIVFSVDFPALVGWDRAVGFWSHGKP